MFGGLGQATPSPVEWSRHPSERERASQRNHRVAATDAIHVTTHKEGLFERLRSELDLRHYSPRTRRAYENWIRRLVTFHNRRHPREYGEEDIRTFLASLVERGASASTHQQALCAITFLFRQVLAIQSPWVEDLVRPRREPRLPAVLTRSEFTPYSTK